MVWKVPAIVAAVIFLTACVEVTSEAGTAPAQPLLAGLFAPSTGQGPSARSSPKAALDRVSFADGAVVVSGPRGYCIDPTTLRRRPAGFAVIASCQILAGGAVGASVDPMLLTVTIGDADNAPLPAPAALAQSAGGRLLSQSAGSELVLVHLNDPDASILSDGDARYWRGVFRQGPHLVSLALYAPKGSMFADSQGAAMLREVQSRITRQSRDPGNRAVATAPRGI